MVLGSVVSRLPRQFSKSRMFVAGSDCIRQRQEVNRELPQARTDGSPLRYMEIIGRP
jgi:hypothetical protein